MERCKQDEVCDKPGKVSNTWRALRAAAVVLLISVGVFLRFHTTSALWLDEAATVNIARLPLHELPDALVRDGHPPAYYVLLHGWMRLAGEGDGAVRALAGLFGLALMPLMWLAGLRAGGRRCAWAALWIVCFSPYAVYYANAARMYTLVMLLSLVGLLLVWEALERPTPGRLAAIALVAGLMPLTHYWTFWVIAATAAALIWSGVRARATRIGHRGAPALMLLGALTAGQVPLLLWIPWFLDQFAHTGTPWGNPADPFVIGGRMITGFAGGAWARVPFGLLAALGLGASWHEARKEACVPGVSCTLRDVVAVAALTVLLAGVGGLLTRVTFEPRYAAPLFPVLVLAVARGCTWFRRSASFITALGLVAMLGAWRIAGDLAVLRTTAPLAARAIQAGYTPGAVVAYCPDDLGPAVARLLPASGDQVTYPRLDRPEFVDYRDYARRALQADPKAFVLRLLKRAGSHDIWLVWNDSSAVFGRSCRRVWGELMAARPAGHEVVSRAVQAAETTESVYLFPASAER